MSEKKKDKVRQSKPPKTKSSDRTEEIIIESAETKAEEANRPALEIVAENNPAAEASAASLPDTKKPDAAAEKKPPVVQDERFDLNTVTLSGVIRSVWGGGVDVFARLCMSTRGNLVEEDDKYAVYATLRFANGMVAKKPISIQKGSVLRVRGYLTHREYNETLRKFLDDAHASSFFDLVPDEDLAFWRSLAFRRQNGIVNVLEMMTLATDGGVLQRYGFEDYVEDLNCANVEGIVARTWEYPHGTAVDLFARLAVYDEHTPIDPKRDGNFGKARRMAHYITVRFPEGKTASGSVVHLKIKARVRINGELRDKSQVVTLRSELLRTGRNIVPIMMGRVKNAERMNEITNQQESLHILANAVVVYSGVGGSR